jgi:hypothetical protein
MLRQLQRPGRRTLRRYGLPLLALVLLVTCASPPAGLLIVDELAQLDRARVALAAQPLLERRASVAVIIVGGGDDRGEDFGRRLELAGMLRGGRIRPDGIAIYISAEPRYSELRAGSAWSAALPDTTLREIRLGQLNPALRAGDISGGVAATLAALDEMVGLPALGGWLNIALIVVGMGLFGLFALRFGGRAWRGSLARRRLVQLWERTPPGRERARRRRREQAEQALGRARAARAEAHRVIQQSSDRADDLLARLAGADRECDELGQLPSDAAGLADELGALARRYGELHGEARALADKLRGLEASTDAYPSRVAARLARVQGAFQRKAERSQRRHKPGKPVSPTAQRRLGELQGRLDRAGRQHSELRRAAPPPRERVAQLSALLAAYASIDREAAELWRAECPGDYAAANPPARGGAYESPSYASGGASSTSSDSSDSSWQSSSDTTGPSSDGGPW